jgi:hypothetical protein
MSRALFVFFALGLCLIPGTSQAAKNEWTQAEMIRDFVNRKLLTQEQAVALKDSPYLSIRCTSEKHSSCRPIFDYAHECSITISLVGIDEVAAGKEKSGLVSDLGILGRRVSGFPTALKAFGKWDAAMEKRWNALKQTYEAGVVIANKNISSANRLRQAKPFLEEAERISKDIMSATGNELGDGCGAPGEDSQRVDFVISEKPKSAVLILQMDFDACKRVLTDPYDNTKCDAWTSIQLKNNELSGNYRYRVIWSDGSVKEQAFKATSTGRRTIEITK